MTPPAHTGDTFSHGLPMNSVPPSSPTPQIRRLFFALWPEPALRERLYALGNDRLDAGGRRMVPENLHLTLVFLGPVPEDIRRCLEERADGIRVPRFQLVLTRLGGLRRRGLVWIEPAQIPPPLLDLVQALQAAQAACGLEPEDREYQAHLTLARDVRRFPREDAIAPLDWAVERFVLVESCNDANGVRYEILRSWELTAANSS